MGKPKRRREGGTIQATTLDRERGKGKEKRTTWKFSTTTIIVFFAALAVINYVGIHYLQLSSYWSSGLIYQISSDGVETKTLPSPKAKFAKECAERGVPVVLRNSVVELWKARREWSPDYLESRIRVISGIYENDNRWFGPYYDERKPLASISTRLNPYRTDLTMSGKQFFKRIQSRNSTLNNYLYFTGDIEKLGGWALKEVYPLQELLALNPGHSSVNVWMGQPHVIAHCHYDGYHNFYAQLYGRKKFTLFKPTNWQGLYPYPFLHPSHAQTQVNLSNYGDASHFPLVWKVEALEVVLEPGDLLYMPSLWFHHVESMDVSISVNVWTDSTQTKIMETVFSLQVPVNKIQWPDIRAKAIATSVIVYSVLEKACRWQTCVSVFTDRFLEQPDLRIRDKQRYFIHRLWSTRYRKLMEKGELPNAFLTESGREQPILCESGNGEEVEALAQEAVVMLEEVGFDDYSDRVGQLVRELPNETWELWVGNYVEYVIANAVDVRYVGVFLREFASCLEFV